MKRFSKILFFTYLVFVQIWYFRIMDEYPFYGIIAQQNEQHQWVVKQFDPASGNNNLDLKIGDIIQKVDNHVPDVHPTAKWGVIEQFKTLNIVRNDQEVRLEADSSIPTFGPFDYQSMTGEIISLGIAAIVYRKLRKSGSARLLAFVFVIIGNIFISLGANGRGDSLSKISVNTLLAVLPFIFMHFLTTFFREKGFKNVKPFPFKMYYLMAAFFCLSQFALLFNSKLFATIHSYVSNIVVLLFLAGFTMVFTMLTKLYFKYRRDNSYETKLINTIWIALCISFIPLLGLTILPLTFHFENIVYASPSETGWFVLFFPASFAYLIMTKQIYDIDAVLRRIIYAILLALLPSILLLLGVMLLAPKTSASSLGILFLFFVALQTFVFYSTEYFTTKLEPVLYPRKHVLQKALKKISQSLRAVFSFRELKETVLVDIVGTLQVHGGAIAFQYPDSIEMIEVGDIDKAEVEKLIAEGADEHPHYSIFEINRHEDYTSYMVMTRKKTNTMLGQEETQWLNLIISYLAVSLENVHLIRKLTVKLEQLASTIPNEEAARELNWFRKLMFELQEMERTRIATDLHDTTLQDLYFLKRRIMKVMDKYAYTAEDLGELHQLINYIEVINMNLRQSCFELNPLFVKDTSLIEALRKLIKLESEVCDIRFEFLADGSLHVLDGLDFDRKRHVFRLMQELINNAKKHSQARLVQLQFTMSGDLIQLSYTDDGVGFKLEPAPDGSGSGFGLEQMKSRIYSLSGHIDIESAPGRGVQMQIQFPIQEAMSA